MKNLFKKNCCDGIYNSFDVHFTKTCDNKCAHCIDLKYSGISGSGAPDVVEIIKTIELNQEGYDDVLFLGGEPCLFLEDLIVCVEELKKKTNLKLYVTTSIPKVCHDRKDNFYYLISLLDGINFSVQHHKEEIADEIRKTKSMYPRQEFYAEIPDELKEKIRINLNIVKPYLYTREDIVECIQHYDRLGFNEIKLSEIQHGKEHFVSFEDTFGISLGSPYYKGCQKYLDPEILGTRTPILLKRSCFMCESTLKATFMDGVKALHKIAFPGRPNKYSVIYEDGSLSVGGWI